jgi:diguanylate cyclase (GGDEF)-like protein
MQSRVWRENLAIILAFLSSISMLLFTLVWESRWKRLINAISTQRRTNHEWTERALHDPLTSLPNRMLLEDRLQHALIRSQRHGTTVAVLFLDLDNFKAVNDKYGHLVGDQLLIAVGERLRQHLRSSDTAGRLGGDEFVVLLELRNQNDPVEMVADRLRRALHVPLLLEPAPITVSTSIGIALSESGEEDPEDLLNEADNALLQAKRSGKDRVIMGATMEQVQPSGMHARS